MLNQYRGDFMWKSRLSHTIHTEMGPSGMMWSVLAKYLTGIPIRLIAGVFPGELKEEIST